jgi:Fur family iron response transcriptional regulator
VSRDVKKVLRDHGIHPTSQRVAVADYLLFTTEHPSADEVWARVQERLPVISRATVYNTLNLFVEKGLVRSHTLKEGAQVFDPKTEPHHHFIDETGAIHDIAWHALEVVGAQGLPGLEVTEVQVVLRGRAQPKKAKRRA